MSDNRRRIKLVLALTARLAGIEAALFLIWTTGALDNYLIARFFPWSIGLSLFILALCYFFGCIARNNTPAVETPDR